MDAIVDTAPGAALALSLVGQFEVLVLTSGLFMLANVAGPRPWKRMPTLIARYSFAICLLVFGAGHFLFSQAVASWVPNWLPAHLFWAYFTGTPFCAAGLAILSGVLARLASLLVAIMLSSWIFLVHIPRVAAALHDRHEWTTLFVAISVAGVMWIVAGSLRENEASV